jgi:hypothetical protein
MNHRVPIAALFAVVLIVAGRGTADDPKPAPKGLHGHDAAFAECAKSCNECALSCDACGSHCAMLIAEGKREHLKTLHTCQDCATICHAAAAITGRAGPFADAICTACADACKRCGDACEQFKDDPTMKACADECRKCEKACREMPQHAGHRPVEAK